MKTDSYRLERIAEIGSQLLEFLDEENVTG